MGRPRQQRQRELHQDVRRRSHHRSKASTPSSSADRRSTSTTTASAGSASPAASPSTSSNTGRPGRHQLHHRRRQPDRFHAARLCQRRLDRHHPLHRPAVALVRRLRAGRLARAPEPDVEPRPSLGDHAAADRRKRQLERLRSRTSQSRRGRPPGRADLRRQLDRAAKARARSPTATTRLSVRASVSPIPAKRRPSSACPMVSATAISPRSPAPRTISDSRSPTRRATPRRASQPQLPAEGRPARLVGSTVRRSRASATAAPCRGGRDRKPPGRPPTRA